MVKAVKNHHIVHMVYLSQIQVVGDKGMQGCLRVKARVHSKRILGYTNGIFGKHHAKSNAYNDACSVAKNEWGMVKF